MWRDAGEKRRDAGLDGCRTGGRQENWDAGPDGCRTGRR